MKKKKHNGAATCVTVDRTLKYNVHNNFLFLLGQGNTHVNWPCITLLFYYILLS